MLIGRLPPVAQLVGQKKTENYLFMPGSCVYIANNVISAMGDGLIFFREKNMQITDYKDGRFTTNICYVDLGFRCMYGSQRVCVCVCLQARQK